MNKIVLGLLVGLAIGAGGSWLFLSRADESAASKPEAAAEPEEKPNPLRVPPAKREQLGIVLAKPATATLAPEVPAFGRVLDPASFATLVSETETARAALTASEKELERARKLFAADGNASAQTVEAAQAAATRDRAALVSAQARLGGGWGREVAREAGTIFQALENGAVLIRIDALPGDAPAPNPRQVRASLPGQSESFAAEIIGPASVADPQVPGVSFFALVREPRLPVGAALRATLPGAGEPVKALTVPRSAIVYHQGSAWIFVLGEEDTFERKLVTLGRGAGSDVVGVLSGLEADEQVATTGAHQLLAAELQAGGAPEP